jgi:nitrite reductase (NADH) small subunit
MAEWVKISDVADLPKSGEVKEVVCGEKIFCVANVNGEISVLDNVCIHRGGPLGQGHLENGQVICPWHGWSFDTKSGAVEHNASTKIKVYPVQIDETVLKVEV